MQPECGTAEMEARAVRNPGQACLKRLKTIFNPNGSVFFAPGAAQSGFERRVTGKRTWRRHTSSHELWISRLVFLAQVASQRPQLNMLTLKHPKRSQATRSCGHRALGRDVGEHVLGEAAPAFANRAGVHLMARRGIRSGAHGSTKSYPSAKQNTCEW